MKEEAKPLMVSIWCATYNHEPYIRQCLDGFVMQKTNFRFEAIVHDDASTDGTASVIREYADNYPEIIIPIYEIENQHSKNDGTIDRIMRESCKGKYIAFCEGDDYWIDPLKLQKQVCFLENNKDYSGTFGNRITFFEKEDVFEKRKYLKKNYNISDVMSGTLMGLQNLCYRRDANDIVCNSLKSNGDFVISYKCAKLGKIRYLDEDFAIYRYSGKGISTSRNKEEEIGHTYMEWYRFHKEIGFKYNRELAKLDIYTFVRGAILKRDFRIHLFYIRKYHAPNKLRFFWYFYFSCEYIVDLFVKFIIGHKKRVAIDSI